MIAYRILILLLMIAGGLCLEGLRRRRRLLLPKLSRWPANLGLGLFARVGTGTLLLWLHATTAVWGYRTGDGFFDQLAWPAALKYAAFLIVVDFAQYWGHRFQHSVPALWRIHSTHHTDLEVDVTTTARVHPLQALVNIATASIALILGVGGIVLGFRTLKQLFSVASHLNVELPPRLDRLLRRVIVTPSYHLVHHSSAADEQASNFCSVFSVWDRMFGTYRENSRLGAGAGAFGLAERRDAARLGFWRLLAMPFLPDFPGPDRAAVRAAAAEGA